jgi:hypothetical protein
MRIERTSPLANALLLYGLLAAPLAWTAQLVVGYGVGEAACSVAGMRWGIEPTTWALALTAATGAVGLSGLATAGGLARELRRGSSDDPRGRVEFMAAGGVFVSATFLALIVLGGVASLYVEACRQA